MSLVLYCGFKAIENIDAHFRPPTLEKGRALYDNDHVYGIKEVNTDIAAKCLSQQSKHAYDVELQIGPVTQGRIMGGTSSLNSMNYVRGNKQDFDNWENTYKARGWKYNDVLQYFKEIENFNITDESVTEFNKYHSKDGETPVNYPRYHTKVSDAFLEACKELDYKEIDYNGEKQTGYSRVQSNTANGIRMSASMCFLGQHIRTARTNLHILTNSTATKIIFDRSNKVTSVKFMHGTDEKTIKVKREVILSAGAVGSPKLLMLSGIGPRKQLEERRIAVVYDSTFVGENLQDHVVFLGYVVTTPQDIIGLSKINESAAQYAYNQTGLFTIPGGFEAMLFTHSGVKEEAEKDHPDLELELAAVFPSEQIAQSPYVSKEVKK